MSRIIVAGFSVSLDGYGAGPDQDKKNPLGIRGGELHGWMYPTRMFRQMTGKDGGAEGIDNDLAEKSLENMGAWIMGRNMFGPVRGPWPDENWQGWWGDEPPYHTPVFILTHHDRKAIEMKGGTIFHFITSGLETALKEAEKAAGDKDIRIGGGVSTIRQYLSAGYIDEIHIAFSPVLLGTGEHLFSGIDMHGLGFNQIQRIEGEKATHYILKKE